MDNLPQYKVIKERDWYCVRGRGNLPFYWTYVLNKNKTMEYRYNSIEEANAWIEIENGSK